MICELDEELKHQIEDSERQDLAEVTQMLENFQKEMSIGRVFCTHHVFFLRQKLNLPDSMIDSEKFACLDRALMNVCNFLLVVEKKKE